MKRECLPEMLDSLAPEDPKAIHSRRDLRIINTLMGNRRWCRAQVLREMKKGERALEIGAGTGELGLLLARSGRAIDGLDLWPRPEGWPEESRWHAEDLTRFEGYRDYGLVLGNFIFHQFDDETLRSLGEKLRQKARVIIACEPWRRQLSQQLMARFAPAFGANEVTQHDAHVSIGAGFEANELPELLGLGPEWSVRISTTMLGAYRMVARKS